MRPLTLTPSLRQRIRQGSRTYQRAMAEATAEYAAAMHTLTPRAMRRLRDGCFLTRADGSARGGATRFPRMAA